MWLCEISSTGAPGSAGSLKRVSKYIIGQIVHIGRKTGSDIAFINDKSVSRNHAEFHLNDRGVLSVRDLKSKFMTYVVCNGVKMVVRDETILKHGDTVQIGACDSRIEVKHVSFLMCPTKLEKERKELLKTVTKKLNGKIVSALDADRSIITVADKFTATMKILESIILNLPIVTLKWVLDTYDTVERAKSSGHCLCLALSTNDYFPPGFESLQQSTQSMVSSLPISTQPPSGVVMENMNQSRKELFGDTLIYTFVEQRDDVSKVNIGSAIIIVQCCVKHVHVRTFDCLYVNCSL